MTVAELIELLKAQPQEKEVCFTDPDNLYSIPIEQVAFNMSDNYVLLISG